MVYDISQGSSKPWPSSDPPEPPHVQDEVKQAVRSLLRAGGHKPSGRGRPASETLAKAFDDGRYPTIHPVVDHFNSLSLRTGIPISVLDSGKTQGDLIFRVGGVDESYIFNPSGQELKLTGLLLAEDLEGPIATPVKDAQRTKVHDETSHFRVVLWGTQELPELLEQLHQQILVWADENGLECLVLTR